MHIREHFQTSTCCPRRNEKDTSNKRKGHFAFGMTKPCFEVEHQKSCGTIHTTTPHSNITSEHPFFALCPSCNSFLLSHTSATIFVHLFVYYNKQGYHLLLLTNTEEEGQGLQHMEQASFIEFQEQYCNTLGHISS